MKLFATSLAASIFAIGFLAMPSTAYAWMPCQLICDTQCIGTEMAIQSVKTLQSFTDVQKSFTETGNKFSSATQAYKKYGDDVSDATNKLGQRIKDLVLTDKPLESSITSRTVQNINALTLNWEKQVIIYNSTLQTTQLSLQNQITAALDAIMKLTREEYISSQTSHITSQLVQNTGQITSYLNNRMNYLNKNLPLTLAMNRSVNKIDGKSAFKAVTKKEAIDHVAAIILGTKPTSDDDWNSYGYLGPNSGNELIATSAFSDDWLTTASSEYSDLDQDRLVLGSQIDLQGMQLIKNVRNNFLMLERLKAKNFVSKEFVNNE